MTRESYENWPQNKKKIFYQVQKHTYGKRWSSGYDFR